jgi:condensin complex subunit 2
MNAENRINAANSWNLNLIDHLDRFVAPELRSTSMDDTLSMATGVNFTKASCTLDASVKIYSYRVDDVHLTSYKVLANLNRSDTTTSGSTKNKKSNEDGVDDGNDPDSNTTTKNHHRNNNKNAGGTVDTLEHNLGT